MTDRAAERAVEMEMILYRAGWEDALRTYPPCEHTHRAIAESVAEMFRGWDGAHAAHLRSVDRFRHNYVSEEADAA
ncbi:hypothetical protein [Micrococcus terreus]|uniref:hypothetical protein n=1 Tax=Micrococcus terreus TaxID=574650 RepID=UPI003017BF27